MRKELVFSVLFVLISFMGCKNSRSLEIAYDVKFKKNAHEETVSLLKTEGDLLADQINSKLKLLNQPPKEGVRRPDPEEVIRLQNNLILLQTRKIEEQNKYIKELEDIIAGIVDPQREFIAK